ncbi:MAG TPA: archease [Myxococcota bacterium]|nr:archease [Myxococcota bacterium]
MTEAAYEFVEGAGGDLTFVARGASLEELFTSAGEAVLAACVEDPARVEPRERFAIALAEPDCDLLLLRFLSELVFLRDARRLLLRAGALRVQDDGSARLTGELCGERIDPARHVLTHDVKAATAYGLRIEKSPAGLSVRVTLDV